MKITDALSNIRYIKPDTISDEMLIDFLSTLDGRVAREIYNDKEFSGYTKDVDRETELLIPYPYQDIYLRWLEAMIDKNNEEMTSFNNNMAMF